MASLYNYFSDDHVRLETLLNQAILDPNKINLDLYHQFRIGLLKHIKMEERIFFLAAKKANNGKDLPLQDQLKKDHGAITSLLVLSPNKDIVNALTYILEKHNALEEDNGGMYEMCENLTLHQTSDILAALQNTKEVPVRPFNDHEVALKAAKNALKRAGYDYDTIINQNAT